MELTAAQRDEQTRILELYPRTVRILRQALCVECLHRGPREGCQFDLLPVTFKRESIELRTCRLLEVWGLDAQKKRIIENSRVALRLDKEFGNPYLIKLGV